MGRLQSFCSRASTRQRILGPRASDLGSDTSKIGVMEVRSMRQTNDGRRLAGNAEAFERAVRQWDADLRGVVWSVVRNRGAVDDVMQSAYERAFRGLDRFDGRSSLKTWLHSICYRTAIDYLRYEGRRRHGNIDDQHDLASPDLSDRAVARIGLAQAFAQLTKEERALMMLTVGLGHSYDDAAQITGLPRGTVASKLRRARKRINAEAKS